MPNQTVDAIILCSTDMVSADVLQKLLSPKGIIFIVNYHLNGIKSVFEMGKTFKILVHHRCVTSWSLAVRTKEVAPDFRSFDLFLLSASKNSTDYYCNHKLSRELLSDGIKLTAPSPLETTHSHLGSLGIRKKYLPISFWKSVFNTYVDQSGSLKPLIFDFFPMIGATTAAAVKLNIPLISVQPNAESHESFQAAFCSNVLDSNFSYEIKMWLATMAESVGFVDANNTSTSSQTSVGVVEHIDENN